MDLNWYAVKIFWNRNKLLAEILESAGVEYYMQEYISTLVFIRCSEKYITDLRREQYEHLFVYSDPKTRVPSVIPDRQFEIFRLVTSAGDSGLEVLGDDLPKYHEGDLVRVLAGPFKGIEGHVKRIKKDRRVVVSIEGVVAVATSFIHPSLLEILTPAATPAATPN